MDAIHYFRNIIENENLSSLKTAFVNKHIKCAYHEGLVRSECDKEKGIIVKEYYELNERESGLVQYVDRYDFLDSLEKKIKENKKSAIIELGEKVNQLIERGADFKIYLENFNQELDYLISKSEITFPDYNILKANLIEITQYLKERYNVSLGEKPSENGILLEVRSFNILAQDDTNKNQKIKSLYTLLTKEPAIINCYFEEFEDAFSGKKLSDGISWLVLGKSKLISKTSLFYFIEQMIEMGHLQRQIIHDLNKYVRYVFRDKNGEELKNLKQSKATSSKTVTLQDRIDKIISAL